MNRRQVCFVLPVLAGIAVTTAVAPAGAAAGYRLAVTFDNGAVSGWAHSTAADAPTVSLVTSGSSAVKRTATAVAAVPADVLAVPGVRAGDRNAASFPPYTSSGADYTAVAVTPASTGYGDELAPGTGNLTFGADVVLPSLPADAVATDNGNNVIQRGLAGGDQYKIQVDGSAGKTFRAGCNLRDQGLTATSVTNPTVLTAGTWYRLRCTRTRVGGVDQLVLGVTDLTAGTATSATAKGSVLSNLDYADASDAKPIPVSIGAKLYNTGAVDTSAADQFNGQIDNGYIAVG